MNDLKDVLAIDDQIASLQAKKKELLDSKRKEALAQVKETIKTFGFTIAELGVSTTSSAATKGKTLNKRKPKYANPANPSQTWGGGARPKWVKEHIENGGKLDDLLIK